MHLSFYLLGLGSNINPDDNIHRAQQLLSQQFNLLDCSEIIATPTVGHTFSLPFKNQLAVISTALTEQELKQQLLALESQLGREPKSPARRSKDRTIDIDIIASGDSEDFWLQIPLDDHYYRLVRSHWLTRLHEASLIR